MAGWLNCFLRTKIVLSVLLCGNSLQPPNPDKGHYTSYLGGHVPATKYRKFEGENVIIEC